MRDDAPIVCFGEDGPAFERLCPSCGRFMKFPAQIKWREDLHGLCQFQTVECSKCGPVEPVHVGWTGDFL